MMNTYNRYFSKSSYLNLNIYSAEWYSLLQSKIVYILECSQHIKLGSLTLENKKNLLHLALVLYFQG
jgi:hypothetical protein